MTPVDAGGETTNQDDAGSAPRRARITTSHDDPTVVADAIAPDNTDQMTTTVTADRVVTAVERPGTGGLQSTVDDYLVNLQVADAVVADASNPDDANRESTHRQTTDPTDADQPNDT